MCRASPGSAATRRSASTTTPPTGPTIRPIFASKTAATQSGLGWIGKTALLVTPQFGSCVRLGTVFTDRRFPWALPSRSGAAGPVGRVWTPARSDAGRDVPGARAYRASALYDRAACDAYQLGFPEYDEICGICIWVCPYTRRAFRRQSGAPHRSTTPRKGRRAMRFAGKAALVTGGSSGIGLATARLLAARAPP